MTDGNNEWQNIPSVIRNTLNYMSSTLVKQQQDIHRLKKHFNKLHASNSDLSKKVSCLYKSE
jgi:uncharacterized coiled-coil protein SlyX